MPYVISARKVGLQDSAYSPGGIRCLMRKWHKILHAIYTGVKLGLSSLRKSIVRVKSQC